MTIAASSGLSDSEIENMFANAEKHAEEDIARKEVIETINEAEGVIQSTEKSMAEFNENSSENKDEPVDAEYKDVKEDKK